MDVTGILPELIASGADPFAVDLPVTGFPAVAREYLVRGRRYATSLAREYYVTPRTVVSWVEKVGAPGLLSSPPTRGAVGGHLVAKPARSQSVKDTG